MTRKVQLAIDMISSFTTPKSFRDVWKRRRLGPVADADPVGQILFTYLTLIPWKKRIASSEVGHPPIIAPIPSIPRTAPPQWLILWSSHLSSLWIPIAFKLWFCSSTNVGMQLIPLPRCIYCRIDLICLGSVRRRLIYLWPCRRCGGGSGCGV